MKTICSLPIILVIAALVLSACSPAPVTLEPTVIPLPTTVPTVPVPTSTASPTPDAQKAAIETAWAVQKPLIDAAVASVFNEKVSSPWLLPVLDITTLTPNSPAAHCQAMKLWDNFIRVPNFLPDCKAEHDPIEDYFGITTVPLETSKNDNFVLKVFFFRPLPFYDGNRYILLPAPGSAVYGMNIDNHYEVVTACGKPTGTPTIRSLYQLLPYLKDPVSMIIHNPKTDIYIEVVVNRGAWFSFGWESGKGWDEVFRVCPNSQ